MSGAHQIIAGTLTFYLKISTYEIRRITTFFFLSLAAFKKGLLKTTG
jgi:hypothetical protein